jgi:hypothetical protein
VRSLAKGRVGNPAWSRFLRKGTCDLPWGAVHNLKLSTRNLVVIILQQKGNEKEARASSFYLGNALLFEQQRV